MKSSKFTSMTIDFNFKKKGVLKLNGLVKAM